MRAASSSPSFLHGLLLHSRTEAYRDAPVCTMQQFPSYVSLCQLFTATQETYIYYSTFRLQSLIQPSINRSGSDKKVNEFTALPEVPLPHERRPLLLTIQVPMPPPIHSINRQHSKGQWMTIFQRSRSNTDAEGCSRFVSTHLTQKYMAKTMQPVLTN